MLLIRQVGKRHTEGILKSYLKSKESPLDSKLGHRLRLVFAVEMLRFPKASSQSQQTNHRWVHCITAVLIPALMYCL